MQPVHGHVIRNIIMKRHCSRRMAVVTNDFARPLVEFWSKMDQTVHPKDMEIARDAPKVINFDYPPPAFIGDILNARIFILMGNGGYNAIDTPAEFNKPDAAAIFREHLAHPSAADRKWTAPYYLDRADVGDWLRSGLAAVVNALAYRSGSTTDAVRRFADKLPSVNFHRRWLENDLRMAAETGRVRVVIHRPGLWRPSTVAQAKNVVVLTGTAPRQKLLSHAVREWALRQPE